MEVSKFFEEAGMAVNVRDVECSIGNGVAPTGSYERISRTGSDARLFSVTGIKGFLCGVWSRESGCYLIKDDFTTEAIAWTDECPIRLSGNGEGILTAITEKGRKYYLTNGEGFRSLTEVKPDDVYRSRTGTDGVVRDVTVNVDRRELTSTGDIRNFRVNNADLAAITKDLNESFSRLCREAHRTGRIIRPVVTRWKFYDRNDVPVAESAPLLMVNSGAAPGQEVLKTAFDAANPAVPAYTLSLESYSPIFICQAIPGIDREVAYAEIESSGEIDLTWKNDGGMADVKVSRNSSGAGEISVSLPSPGSDVLKKFMTAIADNLESVLKPVKRISSPLKNGIITAIPVPDDEITPTARFTGVVSGNKAWELKCPHSFISETASINGASVLHGGISIERFRGYPPEMFALSLTDEPWRGYSMVEFSDGEKAVRSSSGTGDCPLTLSPLLSYPGQDAVKLTVAIERGGKVYRGEYPLTAALNCRMSYYFDPEMKPIELNESSESYNVPEHTVRIKRMEGLLAGGSAESPETAVSAIASGMENITGVTAANGTATGWENSNAHFIVTGSDGIHRVTTDRRGEIKSVSKIHHSGVSKKGRTVSTDRGTAVVTDSGSLLMSEGTRMKPIARGQCESMGYDAEHGEVIMAGNGITATVFNLKTGGYSCRTLPGMVKMTLQCGMETIAIIGNSVYRLHEIPDPDEMTEISMTIDRRRSRGAIAGSRVSLEKRREQIEADMRSDKVENLTFTAGTPNRRLWEVNIARGSVKEPIVAKVPTHLIPYTRVTVKGKVKRGTIFRNIEF